MTFLSWLKFWRREPDLEDLLDQARFEMLQEARRLEKKRSKGKRLYEV